jgi:hypothetical protein
MIETISHSDLLRLLNYEPATGIFTWKVQRSNRVKAGSIAGRVQKKTGYREIKVLERQYLALRLAWFYVHGIWPLSALDHQDGDKLNNRIKNLRVATVSQNAANKKLQVNSTTGFKGVRASKYGWRASIEHNGEYHGLGTFSSKEAAHAAYCLAAERLFGEFARAA